MRLDLLAPVCKYVHACEILRYHIKVFNNDKAISIYTSKSTRLLEDILRLTALYKGS